MGRWEICGGGEAFSEVVEASHLPSPPGWKTLPKTPQLQSTFDFISRKLQKTSASSVISEYVAETRDILVIERVDIFTEKWGTLKRVAGALVHEKFTTPKRWIALDLVAVELSEHGARVGSTLMNVFLDFFPAHEVLLNSKSKVQNFHERIFFVD